MFWGDHEHNSPVRIADNVGFDHRADGVPDAARGSLLELNHLGDRRETKKFRVDFDRRAMDTPRDNRFGARRKVDCEKEHA